MGRGRKAMKKRCFNCMKEYEEQYEVCPHCGYVDGSPPAEAYHLAPGEILNHKYIVGTAIDSGWIWNYLSCMGCTDGAGCCNQRVFSKWGCQPCARAKRCYYLFGKESGGFP